MISDKQVEKISKALSDGNRIKILEAIKKNKGALPCCALYDLLNIAQPSISHHIKTLTDADVVLAEKDGRNLSLTVNSPLLDAYIEKIARLKS
jgi:ArsR family transcriptional regulator